MMLGARNRHPAFLATGSEEPLWNLGATQNADERHNPTHPSICPFVNPSVLPSSDTYLFSNYYIPATVVGPGNIT